MPIEHTHGTCLISDDPSKLDADAIHAYLTRSYWAEGIPRETVARSLANSLCFGVYDASGAQIGLARVVTDCATFAYLCDVYVLEAHRGQGLAQALIRVVIAHPKLTGLRRFSLITRDAHTLYTRFGFEPVGHPSRHMDKLDPEVYRRAADTRSASASASA